MRLIEQVWFNDHKAKYWLVPLLLPFSALFWLLTKLRRMLYRLGILQTIRLTKPVIVVGNISVGGNGKTPMVLWLIAHYQQKGLNVGVVSRGYGGKSAIYPLVVNQQTSTAQAGDEAVMIYQRTKVAVAVGADRIASAQKLISMGCDIIISDDGLQHYRLARDVELAIVDGKRGFGNQLLMPAGPLREGLWRLKSVNYVITNGHCSIKTANTLNQGKIKPLEMRLIAANVCNLKTGQQLKIADFVKHFKQVNAIAGIGSPQRFFETLTAQKLTLLKSKDFADHYQYKAEDLALFEQNIPLLMTEKDAVKCREFAQDHWWYLTVDATINPTDSLLSLLLNITTSSKN
jgi:tetraacyldisaccharide 4'-kinase